MAVPKRNIVLLGKTGSGKSSAGNTMLRSKEVPFSIGYLAKSETSECKTKTKTIKNKQITVIDTPGLFDTNIDEKSLSIEMKKCITECAPGIHAFLIVLKVEKYTAQEEAVIAKIQETFSQEAFKHAIILFTHGDQLQGKTIQEFVKSSAKLKELVDKCGGRYHVIDNKFWNSLFHFQYKSNKKQVTELFKTIETMVEENGGCYTNQLLQAVEKDIQAEEKEIRNDLNGLSDEEIRQEAKKRVSHKLIKLAGVTTGVLVGALLGVAAPLLIVMSVVFGPSNDLKNLARTAGVAAISAAVETGGGVSAGLAAEGAAVAGGVTVGAGLGIAAGVIVAAAALVGGTRGGMVGAKAVNDAETVSEAIGNAAEAVWNDAKEKFLTGKFDNLVPQSKGYCKMTNKND